MTMKTPLERAARALSVAAHENIEFAPPWWSEDGVQPADTILLTDSDKALYRQQARSVLTAIRDPSAEMVEAVPDDRNVPIYPEDIWQAMIDAALEAG